MGQLLTFFTASASTGLSDFFILIHRDRHSHGHIGSPTEDVRRREQGKEDGAVQLSRRPHVTNMEV